MICVERFHQMYRPTRSKVKISKIRKYLRGIVSIYATKFHHLRIKTWKDIIEEENLNADFGCFYSPSHDTIYYVNRLLLQMLLLLILLLKNLYVCPTTIKRHPILFTDVVSEKEQKFPYSSHFLHSKSSLHSQIIHPTI